jgi:hypothetical protein
MFRCTSVLIDSSEAVDEDGERPLTALARRRMLSRHIQNSVDVLVGITSEDGLFGVSWSRQARPNCVSVKRRRET